MEKYSPTSFKIDLKKSVLYCRRFFSCKLIVTLYVMSEVSSNIGLQENVV